MWVFCKNEWCDANFEKPRIPACNGKQQHLKSFREFNIATATLTFVKLHEKDGESRQSKTGWVSRMSDLCTAGTEYF